MTYYTTIKCSWPQFPKFFLELEASSVSVAVAMSEAWIAGFQVGTSQHVTLTLEEVSGRKTRGVVYTKMHDADWLKLGVHNGPSNAAELMKEPRS